MPKVWAVSMKEWPVKPDETAKKANLRKEREEARDKVFNRFKNELFAFTDSQVGKEANVRDMVGEKAY